MPKKSKPDKPVSTSTPADKNDKRLRRSVARDIATANRGAANFDQTSDRDEAYLALYSTITGNRSFTIADLSKRSVNPFYSGASAKASDGGALVRAQKSGNLTVTDAGLCVLTDSAYSTGKAVAKRLSA